MRPRGVVALLWMGLALPAVTARAQIPASIELRVPKAPTVATGDSGSFLAYELHVTNISPAVMALRRVEVVSEGEGNPVFLALGDSALRSSISRAGANVPAAERLQLGGAMRAIVFLWVPLNRRELPPTLRHRLTFDRMTRDSATQALVVRDTQVLEAGVVRIDRTTPRIAAPLRGEWLAANGPSNVTGHRRTAIAVNGTVTIAQRFGIDFLQVDDSGRTFRDDGTGLHRCLSARQDRATCREPKNAEFLAYGQDVLAVADGRVVQTKDSIPENAEGPQSRAVPVTLETIAGNHVVLEIAPQQYALYAHLQPGSLRVRVGDRVKRSQVLGLVGNSGNSTEPHLHFHLVDAIAPGTSTLGAEGIPYALPSFELVGQCAISAAGVKCVRSNAVRVQGAMPLQNQRVRFPD